ncbi:MAG: hypothetical protein EU530_01905 [Promethearchaeota archaeon]|nr:MAG: hypothetical protein EU530_01905 [Candidatus Lokiarchaeota archaeon]
MTDDSSIKPISSIVKKIKKKYDEDKEGWQVHGGLDSQHNHDLIISQNPNTWWLKSKPVDPYRSISFGKEFKNVDLTDLDQEIASKTNQPLKKKEDILHSLFGMSVPVSDQELINAMGIARVAPREMNTLKNRIDEKNPNSSQELKKKVKKKWEKKYPQRDNIFL